MSQMITRDMPFELADDLIGQIAVETVFLDDAGQPKKTIRKSLSGFLRSLVAPTPVLDETAA